MAQQFPILSFQQANPGFEAAQSGMSLADQLMKLRQQDVAAQYQKPTLDEALKQAKLQNQLLGAQAQYAPQLSQAELNQKKAAAVYQGLLSQYYPQDIESQIAARKAQMGLTGAQANLANTQADLARQEEPYKLAAAKGSIYTDPVLARLYQYQQAQKGGISPSLLSVLSGGQQGGGQPSGQSGVNPMTSPNMYGGSGMQNWALRGTPLSYQEEMQMKAQQAGMMANATSNVAQYNNAQNAAATSADDATQMNNYIDEFRNAYDRSSFKGPIGGRVPALGSAMSNEQQADTAANNMQMLVLKLMKTNRLTNYELQFAKNLKLNRQMTPETVNTVGDWLSAKSSRMTEQQAFLNAARENGVDIQTANSLWSLYNNQRPVYDFKDQKVNTKFQGAWQDYLTPQAVYAVQSGQQYAPIPKSKEDLKYLTPQQKAYLYQQMKMQEGK